MTYRITWEPRAADAAARLLKEDPAGLSAVHEAVGTLAAQPRPTGSLPYGHFDLRRLYVRGHRVLYIIDDAAAGILVTHLGRTP